jgi:sugar-specific transcriptional regulator TrmB
MDLLDDLSAIGFTEYEAKVYLALLKEHPATGYQLSKQAGIPRSMVYEALGRLDVRGAVLKTEEAKATLYRPMPPDALLDRLTDEHQRRISALRHELETIYTTSDESHLWTFAGEGSVLSYARNMITSAQNEVMLVLTDDNLDALRALILDADGRGVLIVVVDEQEVLIASAQAITYTATVTTNANMVQIGRQFVWMELFAHRIFSQIGPELLKRLNPDDRRVLESVAGNYYDQHHEA